MTKLEIKNRIITSNTLYIEKNIYLERNFQSSIYIKKKDIKSWNVISLS